jgi:UPF0755 protein
MVGRILMWGVFLGGFGIFLVAISVVQGSGSEEHAVLIPRGIAVGKIGNLLESEGVLSSTLIFKAIVLSTGGNRRVRAGEYAFKKGMGPFNAVLTLYFSAPIEHTVTIPPGWNTKQIAAILATKRLVAPEKFLELALSKTNAAKHKVAAPTLEGFLFPDTYSFSRIDGEERILDRMVQRFFSKVDSGLVAEAKSKGLSLEQLVTFASIIEKETGVSNEREMISSVFHNRLEKKMRLQSDPTTIYGIPNFNGNLTKKDLQTATPYNTYAIYGLPPGAIASPGLAALQAVVKPANTRYLYFVANNKGGHIFSETYAEHSANVDFFQKKRASRRQTESLRNLGAVRK